MINQMRNAFYSKQPNGLYCRFSNVVDNVTHYNLEWDDAFQMWLGVEANTLSRGDRGLKTWCFESHLHVFDWVLERWRPNTCSAAEWFETLAKMGYKIQTDKVYKEECLKLEREYAEEEE